MRYVLESISNVKGLAPRTMLVERVFLNTGARQYTCVESDIMPFGARFRYQNSTEPAVDLTKRTGSVLLKAKTRKTPRTQLHAEIWPELWPHISMQAQTT